MDLLVRECTQLPDLDLFEDFYKFIFADLAIAIGIKHSEQKFYLSWNMVRVFAFVNSHSVD